MKSRNNNSVYNQMQRMAELTSKMVLSGKLVRAGRFLDTAEKLFLKGNYRTRNAVSNVFIYNLSTILQLHHCDVNALFPYNLQKEYVRQSNAF